MKTDIQSARRCLLGCLLLAAGAVLAVSCAGTSSVRYGDSVDVRRYPADIQGAYRVFAVRCSRCHTLARPLNARISDPEHWVRYVTRMRRNPSSGINPKDAEIILSFLLYYTKQVQAEDRGPGAAAEPQEDPPVSDPSSTAADEPPVVLSAPDLTMPVEESNSEPSIESTDRRAP